MQNRKRKQVDGEMESAREHVKKGNFSEALDEIILLEDYILTLNIKVSPMQYAALGTHFARLGYSLYCSGLSKEAGKSRAMSRYYTRKRKLESLANYMRNS